MFSINYCYWIFNSLSVNKVLWFVVMSMFNLQENQFFLLILLFSFLYAFTWSRVSLKLYGCIFSGADTESNIQCHLADIFSLSEHSLLILPVTLELIPLSKNCVWCLLFLKSCSKWCVSDPASHVCSVSSVFHLSASLLPQLLTQLFLGLFSFSAALHISRSGV